MEDDAGGTPCRQIPVMFFGEDAIQPSKGATRITSKRALRLGALLAGENAGGDSLGLVVDQEEGDEESMDDVAVEAEGLLVGLGARVSVKSAETRTLGAALLAV